MFRPLTAARIGGCFKPRSSIGAAFEFRRCEDDIRAAISIDVRHPRKSGRMIIFSREDVFRPSAGVDVARISIPAPADDHVGIAVFIKVSKMEALSFWAVHGMVCPRGGVLLYPEFDFVTCVPLLACDYIEVTIAVEVTELNVMGTRAADEMECPGLAAGCRIFEPYHSIILIPV